MPCIGLGRGSYLNPPIERTSRIDPRRSFPLRLKILPALRRIRTRIVSLGKLGRHLEDSGFYDYFIGTLNTPGEREPCRVDPRHHRDQRGV